MISLSMTSIGLLQGFRDDGDIGIVRLSPSDARPVTNCTQGFVACMTKKRLCWAIGGQAARVGRSRGRFQQAT